MGRIKDYAIDPVIEDTDLVIGTDGGVGQNYVTKNYTVGALKEYIQVGSSLTGWARYDDTVYNASNKLALVDGVVVTIRIMLEMLFFLLAHLFFTILRRKNCKQRE